jgi:hypothetical protein
MKQWVKNYLSKSLCSSRLVHCEENAKGAKGALKIPEELWNEFSSEIISSNLLFTIRNKKSFPLKNRFNTAFMTGFACGWAEKDDSVQ